MVQFHVDPSAPQPNFPTLLLLSLLHILGGTAAPNVLQWTLQIVLHLFNLSFTFFTLLFFFSLFMSLCKPSSF